MTSSTEFLITFIFQHPNSMIYFTKKSTLLKKHPLPTAVEDRNFPTRHPTPLEDHTLPTHHRTPLEGNTLPTPLEERTLSTHHPTPQENHTFPTSLEDRTLLTYHPKPLEGHTHPTTRKDRTLFTLLENHTILTTPKSRTLPAHQEICSERHVFSRILPHFTKLLQVSAVPGSFHLLIIHPYFHLHHKPPNLTMKCHSLVLHWSLI